MLRSLLCLGRDENGYPTDGIDLVLERPKPREPLNELFKLLQQTSEREETLEHKLEHWYGKYNSLHSEYIALKYSDLCDMYQKGQTVESLKRDLIIAQEESRYWQTCYETLLRHE